MKVSAPLWITWKQRKFCYKRDSSVFNLAVFHAPEGHFSKFSRNPVIFKISGQSNRRFSWSTEVTDNWLENCRYDHVRTGCILVWIQLSYLALISSAFLLQENIENKLHFQSVSIRFTWNSIEIIAHYLFININSEYFSIFKSRL